MIMKFAIQKFVIMKFAIRSVFFQSFYTFGLTLIMPRAEAYGSSFVCLFVCHSVFYISFAAHAER